MEKVMPAGTNKFGYKAATSPVVIAFMGKILAKALTAIAAASAMMLSHFIFYGFPH
ncbi:hypothetical protein C900_03229 [Fulvivirga imtechensis AK7]|uniref:Uncharacterized protein n=1 Tax=Fulvivirga imtechensis AK7 TaxID=1237149 RepID=L8JPQ9_9BACT|nr:hypothetical protein C900_03229 [Fulvivirga imtechensis AK7]